MGTIKKPIRKLKPKSEIQKIIKPKQISSEEETVDEVHSDLIVLEQQSELQESEEVVEYQELETASELLKCPSIAKKELTTAEELLAEAEAEEKRKAWLEKLKRITPKQSKGFTEKDGAVTVVNDRNSKRTKLKNKVIEGLGYPDYIKFYVTDNEFVVQASTVDEEGSYKLRLEGKRKCLIYNSEVIELLTEMFELDFTQGTSQTFGEVKFETIDDVKYAVIFQNHK